jgi:hypothetical protein
VPGQLRKGPSDGSGGDLKKVPWSASGARKGPGDGSEVTGKDSLKSALGGLGSTPMKVQGGPKKVPWSAPGAWKYPGEGSEGT